MKKFMFALSVALVSIACDPIKPTHTLTTTNPQVTAVVLSKFDGIILYHVTGGNPSISVYVARAIDNSSIVAQWEQDCGDDCVETVQIQTLTRK